VRFCCVLLGNVSEIRHASWIQFFIHWTESVISQRTIRPASSFGSGLGQEVLFFSVPLTARGQKNKIQALDIRIFLQSSRQMMKGGIAK